MTKHLSLLVYWGCLATLTLVPLGAVYLLFDLSLFAELIQRNLSMPIIWSSVASWQWVFTWCISVCYLSLGLLGVFFLRRPFSRFARGELFTLENTLDLRRFAKCLLAQTLLTPAFYAVMSITLSWHHPAGQKVLSIALGSNEIRSIALALIIWIVSDILVAGERLNSENQQFI